MIVKFILRSKEHEDERYVFDDSALTMRAATKMTEQQHTNVLFNYAIRLALKRSYIDSFILLDGSIVVASVRRNKLYYHENKPKYLYLLGSTIS